jgi:membrane-bound lytic murein transglycosylase D
MVRKSIGLVSACVVLGAFNQACAVGTGQRHADVTGAAPSDARVRAVVPGRASPVAAPQPADRRLEGNPSGTAIAPVAPQVPSHERPAAPVVVNDPRSGDAPPAPVLTPAPTASEPLSPAALASPPIGGGSEGSHSLGTGKDERFDALSQSSSDQGTADAAPDEPGSLWERMRDGFAIPEVASPLVQRHVAWYLNRPDYLARMVERSRRYLHFVVEELQKRDMPLDIALLPMIESAYNPVAYSRAHASGMWQFIPATGRRYGLEQNWWYDGRRDVTAATGAALDYLQKLYGDFGDWHLALAAYNCGEGAVARAIERNRREGKPTDFLSLPLPKETRNYLPKLQAVKSIIEDPERYGIDLEDIPDAPYFIQVNAPSHIDVQRAAQLAELPVEEFRQLNPAHNRPVITADGGTTLLLPVEKAEVFHSNLEANEEPLVTWQAYTLKKKEHLSQVAARFRVSEATLRQANGIAPHRQPRPGQTLLVPVSGAADERAFEEAYQGFQPPVSLEVATTTYVVRRGDTLYSIAARHGATVAEVQAWNRMKGTTIKPGQRLRVAADAGAGRARAPSASKTTSSKTTAARTPKASAVEHRPGQTAAGTRKVQKPARN